MQTRPAVDIDLLCAQASWIRELSRHLVRDPAGADDIAQETLLAALQAPPPDVADVHHLRAWLRRVAINLSRLATRRTVRRQAREERVAQSDRQDSTADKVLRDSVRRSLTEAIGTLEEPYRSTLELRYFEGVSTSDIATRMGTTDNAVRKRLYRARNKLRESLDAVHQGDRYAWFSALLPLAELPGELARSASASARLAPLRLARSGHSELLPLGLGGLGLAAGVLFLAAPPVTDERAPAPAARVAKLEASLEPAALDAPGGRSLLPASPTGARGSPAEPAVPPDSNEPAIPARAADSANVAHAPRSLAVRGRVLDLAGGPVAALPLFADGRAEPLAWSGLDGRFALSIPIPAAPPGAPDGAWARLRAENERWATVRSAALDAASAEEEQLVIVSRAVRVAGRVVDEAGTPLCGVQVRLDADERAFLAIDARLSRTLLDEARATSDELGCFTLASVPSGEGLALEALVAGPDAERCVRSTRVPVPSIDELGLEIRIAGLRAPPVCFGGFVRFEDGSPAADTQVWLGERSTRTDERGAFAFRVRHIPPGATLTAARHGYRQLCLPDLGSLLSDELGSQPAASGSVAELAISIALVLIESQGKLTGRVLDADGRPCAGWLVRADPQGMLDNEAAQQALATSTLTDGEGRFELAGLLEREHRLFAWDPRTLQATRSEPLGTGQDVTLTVAREAALVPTLVGRVTDGDGAPIEGADVRVALALQGREESVHAYAGGSATDALGFFELRNVPPGAEIAVRAEGIEVHRFFGGCEANGEALVVRIPRARELRVSTALDADSFALLDAAGNELLLEGLTREPARRGRLFRGTSILYGMRSDGPPSEVVLYRGAVEIGRSPLRSAPGLRTDG